MENVALSDISWTLVTIKNDDTFWDEWRDLHSKNHVDNIMLSDTFLRLLVQHFPANQIHVLKALKGGRIILMALLNKLSTFTWSTYMPGQLRTTPVVYETSSQIDCNDLVANLGRWAVKLDILGLDLANQKIFDKVMAYSNKQIYAKNMLIRVENSFEDYWSSRNKRFKSNIERHLRQLYANFTELTFNVVTESKNIADSTDNYGLLESKGWKGRAGTAIHPSNQQGRFYREIMLTFAELGKAIVFELKDGDKLLASRLTVNNGHQIVMLKTTFDEEYKKYALGNILLYLAIKHIFDCNTAKEIEFYTNASSEKLKWATANRDFVNCSLYRNRGLAAIASTIQNIVKNKQRNY